MLVRNTPGVFYSLCVFVCRVNIPISRPALIQLRVLCSIDSLPYPVKINEVTT